MDSGMATLTSVDGSDTPSPLEDSMAIRIVMMGEKSSAGDGNGDSHSKPLPRSHDHQPCANSSSGNGHNQEAVALPASAATAAMAMAVAPQPQPQPLQPRSASHEHGGDAGGGICSPVGLNDTYPELMAALAGGSLSISTLGESYQAPSSSETPSQWPLLVSMAPAMAAKSRGEERSQPVVVVAGITIELTNAIGTGSFGKVYKGSWHGRPVAVKVLHYGAELCRSVHSEVLLSQKLRHPNVVAALYFAQVLPGGKLGLQTSGVAGGVSTGVNSSGACPPPPSDRCMSDRTAASEAGTHVGASGTGTGSSSVAPHGMQGKRLSCCDDYGSKITETGETAPAGSPAPAGSTLELASGVTDFKATSLPPNVGRSTSTSCCPADGGLVSKQLNGNQGLPAPLSSQEAGNAATDLAGLAAAVAAAAAAAADLSTGTAAAVVLGPLREHVLTSTSQPGRDGLELLRGDPQLEEPLLMQVKPCEPSEQEATEQSAPDLTSGSSHAGDPHTDANEAVSEQSCSQLDVLSRWDEQRRRQEHVERTGAKFIGPEIVVSANGFLLQASGAGGGGGGGDVCKTAVAVTGCDKEAPVLCGDSGVGDDGSEASGVPAITASNATARGFPQRSSSAMTTSSPSQPRHPHTTGPSTPADAAAAALPLEALWLAAHTQPTEGGSHGFLVMELCEGGSVFIWRSANWSGPDERPDLSVLLRLALDIAYGMSYIHSMGICHGDLKLSNVLLARSSDASSLSKASPNDMLAGWVAKVCDFGLSRVLTGDRTHVSTRPYGTPTHMAPGAKKPAGGDLNARLPSVPAQGGVGSDGNLRPNHAHNPTCAAHLLKSCEDPTRRTLAETQPSLCALTELLPSFWMPSPYPMHLAGRSRLSVLTAELWTKGHMSQPADVYAFGITLWELATGERPYRGLNAARILHRVLLNGDRPAMPPWLPPSYTRLATSCWAQSPKDRPTFGEIVRHLEAMLAVLAAVAS
ncbi:hypothetical protein Vretifemale_13055 [Volvox reticuliferus]|uniref:Protein kinase domain-containing protein n=1 Tax=Volvox reticuliferus TaxID=1737510 RepID=A0A8J4CJP0_9CHLO|nr:hypothetical protein Vretifemale_13055 [Volvox reticuliferus]